MLGLPKDKVRVIARDVGGNFGTRNDRAARAIGFDRVALRRKNLIPAATLPYANPFGMTYDSGEYHALLDRALALADWGGFAARSAARLRAARHRRH
jgi:carbon-monoxide dehydrogenase large subunit